VIRSLGIRPPAQAGWVAVGVVAAVLGLGGCGGPQAPGTRAELDLGNAGTAFRPLTAVLALAGGEYRLAGAPRMHERPIGDLVDALRALGAKIDYLGAEGYPPLAIHPGRVAAGQTVEVRGDVSSQYLSALLLALPLAGGGTIAVTGELISRPYVEITLNLMRRFGVSVARSGWSRFAVPGGPYVSPGALAVEGDASSASYFLAAGAIAGGPVRVEGVGRASIQGDVRFTEVLEAMGARVTLGEDWIEAEGRAPLRAFDLDLNHIPDAAMTAAALDDSVNHLDDNFCLFGHDRRGIVCADGATVEIESTPGTGTTIFLRLGLRADATNHRPGGGDTTRRTDHG